MPEPGIILDPTAGFRDIPRHLMFTKCGARHTPEQRGVNIRRLAAR
jgi:hypothetical protein